MSDQTSILDAVIQETVSPVVRDETLYSSTDNYNRQAAERFVSGGHDTVSKTWEHSGAVVSSESILPQLDKAFPHDCAKIPLVSSPTGIETPHYGLFVDGKCLSTAVKEGYEPHTNRDIAKLVQAAGEAFQDEVKISAAFKEGHLVCVRPSDHYRREIFGEKDAVNPRLVIDAKYGGGAFKATLGWFRDICNNLTWMRSESAVNCSIHHSASFGENLAAIVAEFAICAKSWEACVAHIRQAEERKLCLTEFLADIYGAAPEVGRAKTTYEKRIGKILNRVIDEREKTGREPIKRSTWEVSSWEAYNAVQGYHQHEARRKGNPTGLLRANLGVQAPEVLKAEELVFDTLSA